MRLLRAVVVWFVIFNLLAAIVMQVGPVATPELVVLALVSALLTWATLRLRGRAGARRGTPRRSPSV